MPSVKSIALGVKKRINWLRKAGCEITVTLIQKQGDENQLGISDTGDKTKVSESLIKIILVTRGTDKNGVGEVQNGMELGDNTDVYLEFVCLPIDIQDSEGNIEIQIGNKIVYKDEEYMVFENLPVKFGNTLLINQYTAKRVA